MENDFRNSDKFPPDRNLAPQRPQNTGSVWIPVGVIAAFALVAFFAFGGTRTLETQTTSPEMAATSVAPNEIEPAEGDSFKTQPADQTAVAPVVSPVVPVVETTAPVETTNSIHTYAAEEECAEASGAACHYVTCDSIPEGKQPDEVCGADFKKGWQPIVPTPNKTVVPEEMAPPLSGQGDAPTEEPPLTGQ